jgi:hypothetical protein
MPKHEVGWYFVAGPPVPREGLWVVCRKIELQKGVKLRAEAYQALLARRTGDVG